MSGEHLHPEFMGFASTIHDHPHGHTEYALASHTHPEFAALAMAIAGLKADVNTLKAQVAVLRSSGVTYDFLGKPVDNQVIGRSYTLLDQSFYDPAVGGWEHTLRYLNIKPVFKAGKTSGALRPRLVRADGDTTDFDDIQIHLDGLDSDGVTLRTHTYWELGDGKPTYFELKCIGGLESVTLTTRYTKKAIVPTI